MSSVRIVYTSCPDITPEQARDARARAWKFIFDTYRKKAAGQELAKPSKQGCTQRKEAGMS
jgi:hypothetical protein